MVKSYQRFEQEASFGVITSTSSSVWIPPPVSLSSVNGSVGQLVTGALEEIKVWDIKTGELCRVFKDDGAPIGSIDSKSSKPAQTTSIAYHPDSKLVACGYSDGMIQVWDWLSKSVLIKFSGHKTAISILKFDETGTRLYSGSHDSNIIVWDLVGEVGLYKLRSHKDCITGLYLDPRNENWLISTSKDGLIKVWDLKSQQCVETHMAHTTECWSLSVNLELGLAVTGSTDSSLKIWSLDLETGKEGLKIKEEFVLEKQSKQRAIDIDFTTNADGVKFFYVLNSDKTIEIFRIRPQDEINKALKKREKRLREKGLDEEEIQVSIQSSRKSMLIHSFFVVRSSMKLKSCNWALISSSKLDLAVTTANNTIEYYSVLYQRKDVKVQTSSPKIYTVDLPGHRTDIRCMSVSNDGKILCTCSNGLVKIFNTKTHRCLRTFECGYALCCKILPGGVLAIVGTRNGELQLFDLASSTMLVNLENAHEGAIWSLDITSDGSKLVTGSADKKVKFWKFEIEEKLVEGSTNKYVPQMSLSHETTLEMTDDILCVKLSVEDKYLAVSLLDNTVKVFYFDTMKFYLSLYGHKLPVLSIDISDDSKMIVTSSADKNIKIWGLDFGDCHKSLFAHQDSIMCVRYLPNSHNFFSCSKDGDIKYWDGDKFEMIQKLSAHQSEVWYLAVQPDGSKLYSCSHDHSIRIWAETDDQVFLEEERGREMDELYEENLLNSLEADENNLIKPTEEDEQEDIEISEVHKQTLESLKAGEKLMESLDLGVTEIEAWEKYEVTRKNWEKQKNGDSISTVSEPVKPRPNAILVALNKTPQDYILDTLVRIKPSQLEDALLVLPFSYVLKFLKFIDYYISNSYNSNDKRLLVQYLGLLCKNLFFVIKCNYKELISQKNPALKLQITRVKDNLRKALKQNVDDLGFDLQGLRIMKQEWDLKHNLEFVDEYEQRENELKTSKKRIFENIV
ncbi:probable U3 small nucleolar RNA-associated protein 12 [Saccharomycodes ludwigii]|uniref:Probable U3 small nucleolar RNA-associated protein 12 n=1 Tax=Saccharomycodes ludwigii TaxID=36035 RepID=A0A376B1D2_9ASCO|nr:hypothetical protein SCDLUD_001767 [Saccharomycodes ludwigii]KAH3901979.1 hypothetical protein SCDLUD_001767 [Saccharomycodes ludwigii]SSD58477.1 probable U3 small nucleolar RNA-associated protein 12 [Saccharomycodes ludwigii]